MLSIRTALDLIILCIRCRKRRLPLTQMNTASGLLLFFTDLIVPLTIGYLLKKQKFIKEKFFDGMVECNIVGLAPILALFSFWTLKLNLNLIWLPILGVIMQFVPGSIGFLTVKRKYTSPLDQGSYVLSMMLSNRGVVGMLSLFMLFGETGYAYAQLVMMFSNFVLYLFCYPMSQHFRKMSNEEGEGISKQNLLFNRYQMALVGMFVGTLLNLNGLKRPEAISTFMAYSVHINAWMATLPIGYSINFGKMKEYFKDIGNLFIVKFIATPIIIFLITLPLHFPPTAMYSVVILAISPTAINAVVTSKVFRLNIHIATYAFVATTLLYIMLVFPAIVLVMGRLAPSVH